MNSGRDVEKAENKRDLEKRKSPLRNLFVSVWYAVMKLMVNYISSDIWNFISHITPLCSLLHTLLKYECMCLQDE